MENDRPTKEMMQRSDPVVRERLDVAAENRALKEEIRRLETALEEAKRKPDGFPGDILMHSVVDALLHQAKSLSTLVLEREKDSRPSASH